MGTLLESKDALRSRVLEVSLTVDEIDALITNRADSFARLAFAACPPVKHQPMLVPAIVLRHDNEYIPYTCHDGELETPEVEATSSYPQENK